MQTKHKLNQKHVFVTCAIIASLVLSCACLIIGISIKCAGVSQGDGISFFNLLVDIVIGIFTVWGLFWAASEFAESTAPPVFRMLPGEARKPHAMAELWAKEEDARPITNPPFHISGWCIMPKLGAPLHRDPCAIIPLYLKSETSKAGRNVKIIICVRASPFPTRGNFKYGENTFLVGNVPAIRDPTDSTRLILPVLFKDDLVIYQTITHVGQLMIYWNKNISNDNLPKRITLEYDVYTLDGVSSGRMVLYVRWDGNNIEQGVS